MSLKFHFILSIILCGSFGAVSQKFSSHLVAVTPTAYPETSFDKEAYKAKLYDKFASEPKSDDLDKYINREVLHKEYFFSSNQIYTNWPQAAEYVKKVFNQSILKEFNTSEIKIYVVRDPQPNAYCGEDGNITVTVGFLALINTEAELASTLCHEFGHYYSNHIYNDFKKLNKNKVLKSIVRHQSFLGSLLILQDQSDFRKDQEKQADTFAFNFFTKNGYSPESIIETFTHFERLSSKYKNLRKYRRPLIYFATHPSNEERINNARLAFKNKNIIGKNFLVDSASFSMVKKRAIDETIYLLFEKLQYDECLEMAYLQYLYAPTDEFYLFFITECLRRQLLIEDNYAKDFFITGNYKSLSPSPADLIQKPICLMGNNSKKLSDKNFSKSIFANYKSSIYSLSQADLDRIRAKELIRNDTLEFLFNEDAYDYFSSKINDSACVFNLNRVLFDRPLTINCVATADKSELENDFLSAVPVYKSLKENIANHKKAPVILFKIHTLAKRSGYYNNPELTDELYDSYNSCASSYSSDVIDTKNKFNFRELNRIRNIDYFMDALGIKKLFSDNYYNIDFLSVFPEFSLDIKNFNYKKLLFLELTSVVSSTYGSWASQMNNEKWIARIYVIDLVSKKTKLVTSRNELFDFRKREDKLNDILNECLRIAEE